MPEISVVVELRVEIAPGADPLALEQAIVAEGRRAARLLYVRAATSLEQDLLASQPGARQRSEDRWVHTLAGRVRLSRWRIKTPEGPTVLPLDSALGLGRGESSAAMREVACDASLRLPYRDAAWVLERVTGDAIAHQTPWRVVQAEGGRVRAQESVLVQTVAGQGVVPADMPDRAPELVVLQADSTFLRAQRENVPSIQVRTAVGFTGKAGAGGRRHRRRKLLDKACYATTAPIDTFGRTLAVLGVARYRLHAARHILACHDGGEEFGRIFRSWFPDAIWQADHFHVAQRLWELCRGDRARFDRLRRATFADPLATAKRLESGRYRLPADKATEVAGYLRGVAPDLWGVRKLPARIRRGPMFVRSTHAVEKHQDLMVGRRMKRRGMRWTRRGADHLLALQSVRFSGSWARHWEVRAA